jgi:MFS superfamily sulfate permease-like transporter
LSGRRIGILRRYVPILRWLPTYDRRWLAGDAVAGLSVCALLVPQCLAYATIAGVPVQYGLYTAFIVIDQADGASCRAGRGC